MAQSLQTSARRLALARPRPMTLTRAILPAASLTNKRHAAIDTSTTTPATPTQGMTILENQRLYRPVSPHLSIYEPQVTWILSILNRITGSVLSGGFYLFGAAYALGPLVGLSFTSAGMAASVAKWPVLVKVGLKGLLGSQFVFHCLNGVRHLVWDTGRQMSNQAVVRTGWTVVGLTAVGTVGLLFL